MPIRPNEKRSTFDEADVQPDTAIFTTNVTSSEPPTEMVVEVAFNNATRIDVTEWDGTTEHRHRLNGNATIADDLTRVRHVARNASEYNYKLQSAADVHTLVVTEEHFQGE